MQNPAIVVGILLVIGASLLASHLNHAGELRAMGELLYIKYRYGIPPETVGNALDGAFLLGIGLTLYGFIKK